MAPERTQPLNILWFFRFYGPGFDLLKIKARPMDNVPLNDMEASCMHRSGECPAATKKFNEDPCLQNAGHTGPCLPEHTARRSLAALTQYPRAGCNTDCSTLVTCAAFSGRRTDDFAAHLSRRLMTIRLPAPVVASADAPVGRS